MPLADYSFVVPDHLIAQYPEPERSASRLMVLDGSNGRIEHDHFKCLPNRLNDGDLLIVNNTRVIPARLFGTKATGGKIELLFERMLSNEQVLTRIKASKSPKPGTVLLIGDDASADQRTEATVVRREGEFFVLAFAEGLDPLQLLQQQGRIPLPPYIARPADDTDSERYQTVYSQIPGAVAAPTAGLHFDQPIFDALLARGISTATVTLHVGAGTFQPIRVSDPEKHQMHAEHVDVSAETVARIIDVKEKGGRIIAVGTTSVRSLESAAVTGELKEYLGDTQIFIKPGDTFRVVDGMITNFHLPESTLLMLVSAFAGRTQILNAYREAVNEQYRFYSYGDAMLLWPDRESWKRKTDHD